jgi:hypothetical protein
MTRIPGCISRFCIIGDVFWPMGVKDLRVARKLESHRCDAHYCVGLAIENEARSDGIGLPAEPALP